MESKREGFFRNGDVSWKIISVLIILMLIFSVGIVTFAQPLAKNLLSSTASSNNLDWDIAFTKVIQSNIVGGARELQAATYTDKTASISVELNGVGDSITYDFTITNRGKIDAKVESIYIVPTNKKDDALLFYTSNLEVGDELLSGTSKDLKVTVNFNQNYNSNVSNLEKSATIWVNFVQK